MIKVKKNHHHFKSFLGHCNVGVVVLISVMSSVQAELYFDADLLKRSDSNVPHSVDLSPFLQEGHQPEGDYKVDIYLNNHFLESKKLHFTHGEDKKLHPALPLEQLNAWGVKTKLIPKSKLVGKAAVTDISHYIDDAKDTFDFNQQRLDISLPQVALKMDPRFYYSTEHWESGINAAFTNYRINHAYVRQKQYNSSNNFYMSLINGINIGSWRLRNYTDYTNSEASSGSKWSSRSLYLMRDLLGIQSTMMLGESYTMGDIFDSVSFRGLSLFSNYAMLPAVLQGYAPIVRGIAKSDALVTIRQNGQIVYETNVPPGAFELTDLHSLITGRDLNVTITESSGEVRQFTQAYTIMPMLLRQGQFKYDVNIGRYYPENSAFQRQDFVQVTLNYGLFTNMTLYGGGNYTPKYLANALGIGLDLDFLGALTLDATHSNSKTDRAAQRKGFSYQLRYAKSFNKTSTTINAFTRWYDRDYQSLSSAYDATDSIYNAFFDHRRTSVQVNIRQPLSAYGSFFFTGHQDTFYDHDHKNRYLTVGYSLVYKAVVYSLDYSYNRFADYPSDNQFYFNVSIPLRKFIPNAYLNYQAIRTNNTYQSHSLGIYGQALNHRFNYNLQQDISNESGGNNTSLSVNYLSAIADISAQYGQTSTSKQLGYTFHGAAIVHPYGVTLSPPIGETIAIVRAPGAKGTTLQNRIGLKTNSKGYAIVRYLSDYSNNIIALDPRTLPEDVELDLSSRTIVPTRGAIVLVDFKTRTGARVLMTVKYQDGYPPFGANALIEDKSKGIVSNNGSLYLTGVPDNGVVHISWGEEEDQHCHAPYSLSDATPTDRKIHKLTVICQSEHPIVHADQ